MTSRSCCLPLIACMVLVPSGRTPGVSLEAQDFPFLEAGKEQITGRDNSPLPRGPLVSFKGGARCLAFSPDGQTLASGDFLNNMVRLWEVATGKEQRSIRSYRDQAIAYSPDGKTIASASSRTICLWSAATGDQLRKIEAIPEANKGNVVQGLAFSPDGKVLASACSDQAVRLWDAATGKRLHELPSPPFGAMTVAFSPDGKTLASGCSLKTIRLWEVATGKELRSWEAHEGGLWSLAFAPDGKTLASASYDKTVRLWEVATGKQLAVFGGHQDSVRSVAFSPDGRMLASGSKDSTVRLWEVVAGQERCRFEGHAQEVYSVAFSPKGSVLASASSDAISIWDVTGQLTQGRLRPTNLTPKELDALWADLAGDAPRAYVAVCKLTAAPEQSVEFLQKCLDRIPRHADPQRLARLVKDLDDDSPQVRDTAAQELERLGQLAEPALRKALKGQPTAEVRSRVEKLLDRLANPAASAETLRVLRAIEALEHIGTEKARQALSNLATGAPTDRRTQEARSALDRLGKRPDITP